MGVNAPVLLYTHQVANVTAIFEPNSLPKKEPKKEEEDADGDKGGKGSVKGSQAGSHRGSSTGSLRASSLGSKVCLIMYSLAFCLGLTSVGG